jgi:hypothetical protein
MSSIFSIFDKIVKRRSIQESKRDEGKIKEDAGEAEAQEEMIHHSQRLGNKKDGQDEMAELLSFLSGDQKTRKEQELDNCGNAQDIMESKNHGLPFLSRLGGKSLSFDLAGYCLSC